MTVFSEGKMYSLREAEEFMKEALTRLEKAEKNTEDYVESLRGFWYWKGYIHAFRSLKYVVNGGI